MRPVAFAVAALLCACGSAPIAVVEDASTAPDASAPDALPDAAFDDAAFDDAAAAPDAASLSDAASDPDAASIPDAFVPPEHILFIGNSFTFYGPVPTIVDLFANDARWPDPEVEYIAFGGETLEGHRGRSETVALVDRGGWDVIVLQENSIRPTDALGDPARFKEDATWFHDRACAASPGVRVMLYETWARHPDHPYFPTNFRDPAEMQAQLRFHYEDAARVFIPAHTLFAPTTVELARAGDAWERHLARPDAVRLHGADDYHANESGQYLNALLLYAEIYHRSVRGLARWQVDARTAALLQEDADAISGWTAPSFPPAPLGLLAGERVQIDLGGTSVVAPAWNDLADPTGGELVDVLTADGARSTVDVAVTVDFGGVNDVGVTTNTLGYPPEVSRDSFFAGSFLTHEEGLVQPGQLTVRGLDPAGVYAISLFASRTGDDGGLGRLTRYTIAGVSQDLDAEDNTSRLAVFAAVSPSGSGELVIEVAVSPAGRSRFAYVGAVIVERTR